MRSLIDNTRRPDVVFYRNGKIEIAANVAKTLNLQAGDVIDIITNNIEYYIVVKYKANEVVGNHDCKVMRSNKRGNHLRCYSTKICNKIFSICNFELDSSYLYSDKVRLACGLPTTLPTHDRALPLIIKNPLNTNG